MNDHVSLRRSRRLRSPKVVGRFTVIALSVLLAGLLTAGVAQAAGGSAAGSSPAAVTRTSPVPADAYGWTDCGKNICTFYFTRSATRAVSKYFKNVGVPTGKLGNVMCGVAGYFIRGKKTGLGYGLLCDLGDRVDWPRAAADAVKANGCLQIAYPNKPGRDRTFLEATASWTTHPSYCFS